MQNSEYENPAYGQPVIPPVPPSVPGQPFTRSGVLGQVLRFKFHGTASEYFGIWIVNILLTIVTLSLYAPWAKVRRLRYFYGNTELYNRRFDFTGVPRKILIGRLIAIGIYLGISMMAGYSPTATIIGVLILYAAIPWLIRATLRFTARNSKYGNSRFYFAGTTGRAYLVFIFSALLTIFTLGLFMPVALWLYKRYCFNDLYAGQLKFSLNAKWTAYMGAVYIPAIVFLVILFAVAGLTGVFATSGLPAMSSGLVTFFGLIYMIAILFFWPLVSARIFIATWKNVTLGNSQFSTDCNQWRFAWIAATNLLAMVLSVGLLTPWASIRMYRYKTESLMLNMADDPDQMYNMAQTDHSALAEEISDVFDLDISL